ncbi:MAG: carboxypeptidase-like regulatory domain-containing protein [Candidatus Latescibacteria bacterium]|jgi:hypothetical protein|nr:carboxypeptidase-like regulatory domain-containing protein [Candidatus Latescibacterota bacterium]
MKQMIGCLFLALVLQTPLWAATTGKVMGMVTTGDSPIAGAVLTLKGTGQNATSDAEGRYVFLAVPPGIYTLAATAANHKTTEQPVQIQSDFVSTVDFDLQKTGSRIHGIDFWTLAIISILILLALVSLRIIKSRKQT